jgi:hypothetical protein
MQSHMNARIRLHPLDKVGRHAFAKIAAASDEIYLRIESERNIAAWPAEFPAPITSNRRWSHKSAATCVAE